MRIEISCITPAEFIAHYSQHGHGDDALEIVLARADTACCPVTGAHLAVNFATKGMTERLVNVSETPGTVVVTSYAADGSDARRTAALLLGYLATRCACCGQLDNSASASGAEDGCMECGCRSICCGASQSGDLGAHCARHCPTHGCVGVQTVAVAQRCSVCGAEGASTDDLRYVAGRLYCAACCGEE
jgi:hypothetical protein